MVTFGLCKSLDLFNRYDREGEALEWEVVFLLYKPLMTKLLQAMFWDLIVKATSVSWE